MTTRDDRMQAATRAKNRAKRRIKSQYHYDPFGFGNPRLKDPKVIGKLANTPCPCSCEMCGNPRRHFKDKLTIQEKRENEGARFRIDAE